MKNALVFSYGYYEGNNFLYKSITHRSPYGGDLIPESCFDGGGARKTSSTLRVIPEEDRERVKKAMYALHKTDNIVDYDDKYGVLTISLSIRDKERCGPCLPQIILD